MGGVFLQGELERDTDTLKKEVVDIRLLAQRDIVLDPEAEMLQVSILPDTASCIRCPTQQSLQSRSAAQPLSSNRRRPTHISHCTCV